MVYARDRAAWRAWLEQNHAAEPDGVWLVYYKAHTGKPSIPYDDSVEEALCFGWVDSLIRKLDADRFARKFTPRREDSHWSESNRKRAERLVAAGLMTPAGRALIDVAKASGRWLDDGRPPVDERPSQAFRDALVRHPSAASFFDSLAPAAQKLFILWINTAKKAETRERRVNESITLLEQGQKLGMK
jgi:uncharacterized protein YdeI (YjbR/CyaY-like superfamily)